MKKEILIYIMLLMLLIIPFNIKADTLTTYGETVTKANHYITSYNDRRKYLIFNKNYVYEKSGFGDSGDFTTGGLLSKSEFDLSIVLNQSYLANGKEYWTLTSNGSNKYYIDAYVQSKSASGTSGTRVTQYVKPSTIVNGKGTYANPWTFSEGYQVDIISNNTKYGTVNPSTAQYVTSGSTLRYTLVPSNGFYYNGLKDECNFVKEGTNKYENNYLIENINKDITCTAVFELQPYKFNLEINNESKDYNNTKKTYATTPSPNPIYFKYKTNWYSNSTTTSVINKITLPVITGWTFNGYYYGSVKVIDAAGNIIVKDLNLGNTNDFRDIEHTLYANITKNTYSINYNLNGGSFGTKHPTSAKYDEVLEISNPKRAGYSFAGWSFNGNSSTAKTGNTSSNVNTTFTANSTKTLNQYFVNLTPTNNGAVTMTANWSACPAGTYNDGTKTTCTTCPARTYTLTTTNTSCKTCEAGYYCLGGSSRGKCASGYTSDAGSDAASDCRIIDSIRPTCSLYLANGSTIQAAYNDTGGSGVAYYGWSSSYSGSSSYTKGASAGTHTFYVKDGSGNTNSCSITLSSPGTEYLCDNNILTDENSGIENGCNSYDGVYECSWNGSRCACKMAGFYSSSMGEYYCCSSYDDYETADWDVEVNGKPGCIHYFSSTGTAPTCSSGYSYSNGWCYR